MINLTDYIGWGTKALEVVTGLIFVVHGWAKLKNPAGIGAVLGGGKSTGVMFGLIEVAAGAMIATGLGTFWGALAVIVVMLGAIWFKIRKWKTPFKTDSTGWEFDLLILAAALTLLVG